MAVVITPFPHQDIEIGSNYSLDIAISGSPTEISVDGRVKGFSYNWTGSVLELRGVPEKLAERVPFVITADDVTYRQTFTIHPVIPVIQELSTVRVTRGQAVTIPIPIVGHVSKLEIEGPWIGLRYRLLEDTLDGEMYGTVPLNAELTRRLFSFLIKAHNRTVFGTRNLNLEVMD